MTALRYDYADVYINDQFEKRVFLGDRTKQKKDKLNELFKQVKVASNRNPGVKYHIELKYE